MNLQLGRFGNGYFTCEDIAFERVTLFIKKQPVVNVTLIEEGHFITEKYGHLDMIDCDCSSLKLAEVPVFYKRLLLQSVCFNGEDYYSVTLSKEILCRLCFL